MRQDLLSSPGSRAATQRLAADLERVFGTRLQALLAYEPADSGGQRADAGLTHTLALVERLSIEDLSALLTVVADWHKRGLATPLLVTGEEFERTLDVFPLEYGEILARHVVLRGALPEHARVGEANLRRACERQIKGHLIHLREGYLETHGRPATLADLLRASVPPFRAALANIARLHGAPHEGDEALAAFAAAALGTDGAAAADVLRFGETGQTADAPPLLPPYLRLVERLWQLVDGWSVAR
jgi:hypothetical protein